MWDWYAGMLVWKNQNPWTSLRGSFYDYYLDYQGGYYGFKHAAAPVHIQLNLNDSVVCALNQTALKTNLLTARIMLYNMHGKLLSEEKKDITLQAHGMELLNKVSLPKNTNEVFFLKLQLTDKEKVVDENLYWLSNMKHSYEKLNELEKVTVTTEIRKSGNGSSVIKISNLKNETAFFIRLKVTNSVNEVVLPAYFTENYITLLPGDEKEITLDLSAGKAGGGLNDLRLVIEGWNVSPEEIKF
jgi:hypothetical protein